MGAPVGKAQSGAAVTCRASTIRASLSGWLCLHPPGPCYSVHVGTEFTRGPLRDNTEPPEWSLQCGRRSWTWLSHQGSLPSQGDKSWSFRSFSLSPSYNSKGQFPKQAPPGGSGKEPGGMGATNSLWLFSGPKGHGALLGPVANFALPCRPQGSREG